MECSPDRVQNALSGVFCFREKIRFFASNEPSVYAACGNRFLKPRIDTGLLLYGLWDSVLWYGRIISQQDQKTSDGLEDEL